MISFVIPAHNEEHLLGRTLAQINAAACGVGLPFEVIVVDDGSTDRTAEIAQSQGARVVHVNHRKISAVRNAGARVAEGSRLVFVDADTLLPTATLGRAMAALDRGVVGGGARVESSDTIGFMPLVLMRLWNVVSGTLRWAAGCFVFVRRDVFEAVGGFDEQYYVTEELYLSQVLKRRGLFVILSQPVYTSARKARMYSAPQLLWRAIRILISGPRGFRRRHGLDLWYGGQRERPL